MKAKYQIIEKGELSPTGGEKSFYGKATFTVEKNRSGRQRKVLFSYGTPIMAIYADGKIEKYWHDWTATTGRHIKAFCGMNKKQFDAI